ncbi:competence protein E/type II secretory pathway, component HofQ [Glaesserella parasuis]|nr:competence protein E/type II secretory pathway, component HofQ [Glaesserella parasuis]
MYSKKEEITDIEFREAVLGLEVTPHISKQNQILLDLAISQNSPNNQINNTMVTIDKQEIKTQVLAKHGETIVLGGIFQHLIAKGEDKVPLLGSIPVIKRLFSQNRDRISKRELVIFVTPYIVKSEKIGAEKQK